SQNVPEIEKNLALRWSRRGVGDDVDGMAVLHRSLTEARRHEEALAIADSVLASLLEPAPGAPPRAIRTYKEWLQKREISLASLGRIADAETVRQVIFAAPPRDPALPENSVDLSAFYNGSLYDGRGWGSDDLHLAF